MAYEPINYANLLPQPQSPTAGLDAFQAQQMASAQRALAASQAQQQMRMQQLQNAALQDALTNPSPQTYRAYMLANPQAAQATKAAYDGLDTETQRQQIQDLTAFYGHLQNGDTEQANSLLQRYIDAHKKAGQDTTNFQALQQTLQTNPKAALAMAGMALYAAPGADKYFANQKSAGEEARAQAEFPLDLQAKQADIALKTAQAAAAGNDTDVNPVTGAYYNKKAPPPAAAATSNNGALDNIVGQIIQSESGGDPAAKNPGSSATGAGQFLSGTWVPLISRLHPDLVAGKSQQEILDLRKNPQLAAEATSAYAQDNAQALAQANLPVNGATIAMAHRLGPGDAQKVLQAQANAPLSQILSRDVIKANPQYGRMTAGQFGQQLAQRFGTTAIDANPGDPNASGEEFLRTLSPQRAAQIRAIANGDLPLPTGRAAASGPGQFLAQQVLQYDPTASAINLDARRKTRLAFTSGTQGQSVVQANTVGGHLAALDALADNLHNGPFPFVNSVANTVQVQGGNAAKQKSVTDFNTLSNTLASELTKFYRNNGGSEKDVEEFRRQLNSNNSPTQIHAAIRQMAGAVLSKIDALSESYNTGMGKVTDGIDLPNLNHNAIGQLQRLAGESGFGGGKQAEAAPQVYVNPQTGQRIVYDASSRSWKAAS